MANEFDFTPHMPEIAEVNSLFQQPWWLEAVAPGGWNAAVVRRNGAIVARMPYVWRKGFGMSAIIQPQLTPAMGPWFRPSVGKYAHSLNDQKEWAEELISSLPKFDVFFQNFPPAMLNWLPFFWAGFEASLAITYRLDCLENLEDIWNNFVIRTRTCIRKAEKIVRVRDDLPLSKLMDLVRLSYARQKLVAPYSENVIERLYAACGERNCGKAFFAEDAQGRLHSAIYIVWDKNVAYYLLSGGDPELRNSGANSLLLWHAIQFASKVTKSFDFEGSMSEPVERFIRSFGACQVPYLKVRKLNTKGKILWAGRKLAQPQHWRNFTFIPKLVGTLVRPQSAIAPLLTDC